MFAGKEPLLSIFFGKSFFLKKKLAAVIIFISLSVNGYAHSALEVSKYSLMMLAVTVVKGTVTEVFKKCDESLGLIAKGLYGDIIKVVKGTPFSREGEEKKGEEEGREGKGIKVKQVVYNQKEEIRILKEGVYKLVGSGGIEGVEVKGWGEQTRMKENKWVLIIFLIFIAVIVRRKGISEEINRENKKGKEISV